MTKCRKVVGLGHRLVAVVFAALACNAPVALAGTAHPRVGLVLGGGGARGVAHIGVLRVLEEMRIPVSCIAGTSMGALVGGLYAAGMSPDEMTQLLSRIDWDRIFSDDPPRSELPFRAKQDDFQSLFRMELGERDGSLLLPPGATAGYKFEFLLREAVDRAGNLADQDFDRLPIPFRALATNIEDGTSREFRRGDLVKAMRASMSVPGAIAPAEIDGVLYVDGGLLQNLPVEAAREACADVVIAVNVGSGLLPRETLHSALGVSLQMVNVLMAQNVRASIASLAPDDVLIEPELGNFSATDFDESLSLIPVGEAAARSRAASLAALSVSEDEYRAWRAAVLARLPAVLPVTEVRVATRGDRVNSEVIERELAEVPGVDLRRRPEDDFSISHLNERLAQVYGRGEFERIDYRMVERQGRRTVEVEGVEKSWGPNYLKFGLGLAADSENTRFTANLSHRSTWVNRRGAEWRNDLQLGYLKRFASEFFQPLSLHSGAFIAPRFEAEDRPIVFFLGGRRVGEYRVARLRAQADAGLQNKYGELRAGLFAGRLKAREDFGTFRLAPDFDLFQIGYSASATFDQIDSPQFGRNGLLATLKTTGTLNDDDPDGSYNKTELFALGARSMGDHTVQLAAYYGLPAYGGARLYDPFLLGGFLRGSGYRMDELLGARAAMARAVYAWRFAALPHPLGSGVYLGGSLEATHASLGASVSGVRETRLSASVFLSADTFLGPAYLAWGQGLDGGRPHSIYLMLGYP